MEKKITLLSWVPLSFYMNVLYCFGASIMDSYVVYPGWRKVGRNDFMILHDAQGQWIINAFVIPLAVTTLFNLLMLWVRPAVIPRKLVLISLACMLTNWIISSLVQIPMHKELETTFNGAMLNNILWTNNIRVAIQAFQIIIVYRMMRISIMPKAVDL